MRLVDADALQRAFDDAHKDEPDFFCCNFLNNAGNPSTEWDCVDDILENAPTIDAQPVKQGKWTECWRDPARNVISVICSACGDASITYLPKRNLTVDDVPKKICIQMPHCPKCGARMEVEKDGTRD